MAKLIGTGADPRLIKGADFDVRDDEVDHYESEGLGVSVDPVEEPERIHAGPTFDRDVELSGEGEAETPSARVGGDEGAEEAPASAAEPTRLAEGLSKLSRAELDARAKEAGVEDPEALPNRDAVAEAIRAAEDESGK